MYFDDVTFANYANFERKHRNVSCVLRKLIPQFKNN